MIIPLTSRRALPADAELLGELSRQLMEDENQPDTATLAQHQQRMRMWLEADHAAVIFKYNKEVVAYALYLEEAHQVWLKQFFVLRDARRKSIGQQAMRILRSLYWPAGKRLVVEVLMTNEAAIAFYKTIGFRDYNVTLEIPAETRTKERQD